MKLVSMVAILSLFSFGAMAKKCGPNLEQTTVSWTGYKLAKKVGVKGKFTDVHIQGVKKKTIKDYIESATFSINASKMNSGNKGRDLKIAKFFFGNFKGGPFIKGLVNKVEGNKVHVLFSMNQVAKEIVLDMKIEGKKVTLTGSLDFMDFMLNKSYKAISKACEIKHEGKTWSEAGLEIVSTFDKSCKA